MKGEKIMNENIIENNEVLEAAEDVVSTGTGIKLVGGALILGAIYGGIKLFKKLKAKKAEKDEPINAECVVDDECEEDE